MTELRRTLAALAVALAAIGASPALADMFADWDANGDGVVSRDEFHEGMGAIGVYRRWDANHDGILSDDEFRAAWGRPGAEVEVPPPPMPKDEATKRGVLERGYFDRYDANHDGLLERPEFERFERMVAREHWFR
ncbi:EF hand [Tistlia consotensis]|uniref:EF hand n=1 Tax=Tistlia consotensis USBA 355 TaxID=560819 RepID=A0A1Y6BF45_9PROT|nr:EF-hand domain-containing protein [Tistlia consotensis]SMF00410.1 EF hand [Tistlia consotensis USBA 355]SNR75853.1 EF hand [Tistlia consotensis]